MVPWKLFSARPDLLEVVLALRAGGGLADLLDGGQQQADQDRDDGDHHQQFDQGEAAACGHGSYQMRKGGTRRNRNPAG